MGFLDDLAPLTSATVVAKKVVIDGYGNITSTTSTTNLTLCHIEGENKRVTNANGVEVVSSYQIYSLEDNGLWAGRDATTKEEWRFTLPVADYPTVKADKVPINIIPYRDEDGKLCEEIQL